MHNQWEAESGHAERHFQGLVPIIHRSLPCCEDGLLMNIQDRKLVGEVSSFAKDNRTAKGFSISKQQRQVTECSHGDRVFLCTCSLPLWWTKPTWPLHFSRAGFLGDSNCCPLYPNSICTRDGRLFLNILWNIWWSPRRQRTEERPRRERQEVGSWFKWHLRDLLVDILHG